MSNGSSATPKSAITDYTKALALDTDFPAARLERGQLFASLHRYDEAMADYDETIREMPSSDQAYVSRGIVWRELGDFDSSLADLTKALTLKSGEGRHAERAAP